MPFKLILCPKLDKTALALKVVFQVRVAPVGCTVPAATRLSSGLLEQGPGGPLKIRADVTLPRLVQWPGKPPRASAQSASDSRLFVNKYARQGR